MKNNVNYLIKSGIFGLVVGDALGVPYEFKPRIQCDEEPMTDMIGYGAHYQPPGTWSDDSSLVLATIDGLIYSITFNENHITKNGTASDILEMINYEEIMKNFACWCFKAKYSPNGEVFDWGGTTEYAIKNFKNGCEPLLCGGNKFSDNGNGSLMRILPIAYFIYLFSLKYSFSEEDKMKVIHNLSSLTHRHGISQMACGTYVLIAIELLKNRFVKENGLSLEEMVKNGIRMAKEYYYKNDYFQEFLPDFDVIFNEDIKNKSIDIIRGRGYVISSLEASLWCLLNNNSYKETALAAVNLGEDTDTTAAIACGLAGIYYGYENIPTNWLDQIVRFDFIEELIGNFSDYLSNI